MSTINRSRDRGIDLSNLGRGGGISLPGSLVLKGPLLPWSWSRITAGLKGPMADAREISNGRVDQTGRRDELQPAR